MRKLLIALIVFLAGCGALTGDHPNTHDASLALPALDGATVDELGGVAAAPDMAALAARLSEDLARLGVDPAKVASQTAGAGNAVFDLRATVARETVEGDSVVELRWTERLVGDYNMDGMVGVSDLTPLGMFYNATLAYRAPSAVSAIEWYPQGDPDDDGIPDTPESDPAAVAPDSATARWRLARVDGDFNGTININDVTPIAYHYNEVLTGYRLFRLDPGATQAEPVLDPETNQPVLIARDSALYFDPATNAPNVHRPVRYYFEDTVPGDAEYQYFVRPYTAETDETGPQSNAAFADTRMQAMFTVDQTTGSVVMDVAFDAAGSYSPNGIVEYEWDFTGSNLWTSGGTEPLTTYTYNTAGNYIPQLRITDTNGAQALGVLDGPIEVWPVLRGQLQAHPDSGSSPLGVDFSLINIPDVITITDVLWDFNGNGVFGDIAQEASARGGLTGGYTYSDGGVYLARAQVFDSHGRDLTLFHQIAVDKTPPQAALTADVVHGEPPLTVQFDAQASTDLDGGIRLVYWDFDGDGSYDSGLDSANLTATHEYTTSGVFNATILVTDTDWLTSEASVQVIVNHPPVANAEANPPNGNSPLSVEIDASGSTDTDGTIVSYEFDFGEGGGWTMPQTDPTSSHVYGDGSPFPGHEYTALVRVTDDLGDSDTATITIPVINSPPIPWMTASPQVAYSPRTVNFGGANSTDPDGQIVNLEFDFGEGYGWISTGIYPYASHTYSDGGPSPDGKIYTSRLRVTDDDGATAIVSIPIKILNTPPTAALTAFPSNAEAPVVVILDAGGSTDGDGMITLYEFQPEGDPGTWVDNGGSNFYVYTYMNPGVFTARVRCTDDDGETATQSIAEVTVTIN